MAHQALRFTLPFILMLVSSSAAAQEAASDLFVGTIVAEGDSLFLERCNGGRTLYRLSAAHGQTIPSACCAAAENPCRRS